MGVELNLYETFIKKINEIEVLKEIILNDDHKVIFEFLSFPNINIKHTQDSNAFDPLLFIKNKNDLILRAYEFLNNKCTSNFKSDRLKNLLENLIIE